MKSGRSPTLEVDEIKTSKLFQLHLRDARELTACVQEYTNEKDLIDVTITSPPYHDIIKYGEIHNQVGYGQEYVEYKNDVSSIFEQIYYLTKESGSLWVIVDSYSKNKELIPLPFELVNKITENGWILKNIFIWKKDKTRPWAHRGQLRKIFEYILFFVKSQNFKFYIDRIRELNLNEYKQWWVKYPERYNPKGKIPTNVWEYPIPVQGAWRKEELKHSNPLPVGLIHRILTLTTDEKDVVCDPFSGTGTVLAAAQALGRKSFGFELNEDYIDNYNNNIRKIVETDINKILSKYPEFANMQKNLASIILNLRLVKFPKSVFKTMENTNFIEKEDKKTLNTIFSIKTFTKLESFGDDRTILASEDIYFIFKNNPPHLGLKDLDNLLSEREITRFQIFGNIIYCDIEDMISKPLFNDKIDLWLYKPERLYKFDRKISFKEWIVECRKDEWDKNFYNYAPPIISNVKVNQEIRPTWVSREEIEWLEKEKFEEILDDDWKKLDI